MRKKANFESLGVSTAKMILAVSFIVSFGALLGAAGYLINNKPIKFPVETAPVSRQTIWKVYQNKILGYEIQYPSNWTIKEDLKDNRTEFISKENTIIAIGFIPQDILNAMGISYCGAYPDDKNRCEWIVINGTEYAIEKNSDYEVINIITPNGGALFIGLESTTSETKSIFRKMLPAFKFIDKDEISDWKTYKNEEYGFELKHPEDFSFKVVYGHVGPGVLGGEYEKTAIAIHFVVPATNSVYSNGPKEMPILTILVYTNKQWEEFGLKHYQELSSNKNRTLFLGENKKLMFISDNVTYEPRASANFTYKSSFLDQILSTFKFIEKNDDSTWRTYKNTREGDKAYKPVEIKIPGNWQVTAGTNDSFAQSLEAYFPENNSRLRFNFDIAYDLDTDLRNNEKEFTAVNLSGISETLMRREKNDFDSGADRKVNSIETYIKSGAYFYIFNLVEMNGNGFIAADREIYDQIISTFKFAETGVSDIGNLAVNFGEGPTVEIKDDLPKDKNYLRDEMPGELIIKILNALDVKIAANDNCKTEEDFIKTFEYGSTSLDINGDKIKEFIIMPGGVCGELTTFRGASGNGPILIWQKTNGIWKEIGDLYGNTYLIKNVKTDKYYDIITYWHLSSGSGTVAYYKWDKTKLNYKESFSKEVEW